MNQVLKRPAGARERVLLVSSSDADDAALRRIFAFSPWQVVSARTRAEAIDMIRKRPAPMIICDRSLPDGTWKDILEESAHHPGPACIIVTTPTEDDAQLCSEVLNLGGYEVLAKPFRPWEVLHIVNAGWSRLELAEPQVSPVPLSADSC